MTWMMLPRRLLLLFIDLCVLCLKTKQKAIHLKNVSISRTQKDLVLLFDVVELLLLQRSLETTMAELGGGIDEGEGDLFEGRSLGVRNKRLTKGKNTLLSTRAATLDHDEVVLHNTVVRETTHGSDGLLRKIGFSGGVLLVVTSTNTVDLLVDLSTVEVTVLTSTSNAAVDTARMPRTNTSDLTKTSVSLTRKSLGTESLGDTSETVTLGDSNDIDVLVLGEDAGNLHFLLKEILGEVDLGLSGTTVDLDFHKVSLLLTKRELAELSVSNDTDDGAVVDHSLKLSLHALLTLIGGKSLGVLGEGLLLGVAPVLVESALDFLGKVLGPDGGESTETTRSLDVTDDTDNNERRTLDDGDGLDDFLLVALASGTIDGTEDVGHTSLVAHESSKMGLLLRLISGETSDVTTVVSATLTGGKTEITVTGL